LSRPTLLDELVELRMPWVPALIRSWYAEDELRGQLRTALAPEAERVGNAEFGAGFRDSLGLDAVPDALAWANRRLELAEGGSAVTGIRFRGRDERRPFVDVVATSAPPTPDGLAVVAAAVEPAYQEFGPLCLRVDAPDAPGLVASLVADYRFGPGCDVDMHVMAGRVSDLREYPRAASYPQVRLRRGEPGELGRSVAEIYAELTRLEPDQAAWANPEDAESLAVCAKEDLLFEVLVDEVAAGVVAAVRDDDHALRGFSVQELCLDPAHRGRRLAPAVVQRLLDELPARPGDVLWGTIHPANTPSWRNALAVGREPAGGFVWVTPGGWPGMPPTTR
jgi:L-amino acid N-acyltransferase YncA